VGTAILMTGEGDQDLDSTAAKAGAANHLIKGELTAALLERSILYATLELDSRRGRDALGVVA
jgi:hypothetical protein